MVTESVLFIAVAVVMLGLVFGSALFSAIETSLFSLQPAHIERLKARRAEFGEALSSLMANPRRLLSAILLADALVNLPLIILSLFVLQSLVSPLIPFWAAALAIFAVIVFACDLVPKLIALSHPYRMAGVGVRVLRVLMPIVEPAVRLLQHLSERAAEAMTPEALKTGHVLSDEEMSTLIELSAEEGVLHETESEMIQQIMKLGDKTVRDCMTPRVDAFTVPDSLTNEQLIPRLRLRRHRRVPVYGETPDEILGILDTRAFLLEPTAHYTEHLLPPSFVPETMEATVLLRAFLSRPQGLAIVVDEHGGTEGIITFDDLAEEIISDAVPTAERTLYIETVSPGRLLVNGNARLDDINALLETSLEEEGVDTIGGFIFHRLGALPKPGAELQVQGLRLTVRRASRKRVEEIFIEEVRSPTAQSEE